MFQNIVLPLVIRQALAVQLPHADREQQDIFQQQPPTTPVLAVPLLIQGLGPITPTREVNQKTRPNYDNYILKRDRHYALDNQRGWPRLLAYYNKNMAIYLQTEEAALQFLAQELAYFHPREGDVFNLNIRQSFVAHSAMNYAPQNKIVCDYADTEFAVVLTLAKPVGGSSEQNAIMCIRGTNGSPGLCASGTEALPREFQDDLDFEGIGRNGFRKNVKFFKMLVSDTLREHKHLVLIGHSLGGAYAACVMACLPASAQARIRMITFNAPAVNTETANAIVDGLNNIRLFRHVDDFVPLAGQKHPPGILLQTRDTAMSRFALSIPHCQQTLVLRELNGETPPVEIVASPNRVNPPDAEIYRKLVGLIAKSRVPV